MSKPTLLVADADPSSQSILELALRKAGFAVETTADGAEALQRAPAVDLLVCEAALPSTDGIAVCRALRAQRQFASLPILITSADKNLAARALEAGADEFLRKPILLKELVRRVQVLLERRDLAQGTEAEEITGSVRDLGLIDMLQSLLAAKKSALVKCEAYDRTARIWVRDGEMVDAELGALKGAAAFARLLTWESGIFKALLGPVDREAIIEGGTEAALVDGLRRVEEVGRISEELAMTTVFAADWAQLTERLGDLPDEVNGVVRNFDGRRTLREAIDFSPVDDLSALAVVRRLIADGILHPLDSNKTPLAGKRPSLHQWLSNPPPPQEGEAPVLSLDDARAAAALVEELAAAEAVEHEVRMAAEHPTPESLARYSAPVTAIEIVRFPPLRGARRERLRREAEEARARIGEKQSVRLSRVVELPPWHADGADALHDSRQMSPSVGEAARTFAPDAPVARVNGGVFQGAARHSLPIEAAPKLASAPPDPMEEPQQSTTPPIAPVVPFTPEPAIAPVVVTTPSPARIAPGTPPPDRGLEAEMMAALRPKKRPWGLYGLGAVVLLAGAWFLRPQPHTDKKDSPWLAEPAAPRAAVETQPAKAAAPEKIADPPKAAAPGEPPPSEAMTPASDLFYAKALEQGEAQVKLGKYSAAVSQFQRAVREKPQAVPALLALGDALLEADKPRSAIRPLETAARVDPQNGRAQLLLGTAWQSLGKNKQAVKAYRHYLELEPNGEFAADVRLILANLSH